MPVICRCSIARPHIGVYTRAVEAGPGAVSDIAVEDEEEATGDTEACVA
jgi:hypothetical protein